MINNFIILSESILKLNQIKRKKVHTENISSRFHLLELFSGDKMIFEAVAVGSGLLGFQFTLALD